MMWRAVRLVPVMAVLVLVAQAASAQGLAEAARAERERRAVAAGQSRGRRFSNRDLKPVPPAPDGEPAASGAATTAGPATASGGVAPSAVAPSAAGGSTAASGATASGATAPGEAAASASTGAAPTPTTEAEWRQRQDALQEALGQHETLLDALQSRINGLTTDFVNRDDPSQRARIAADRQKALQELDRLRTEVAADRAALSDLVEQARRAGVPAGWLR